MINRSASEAALNARPDVVLVNTPIHNYCSYPKDFTSYSTPLGLNYLAAAVRAAGLKALIIDAEADKLEPGEISERLNRLNPLYAGFNAFTVNFELLEQVYSNLRREVGVIVGGPHITLSSDKHIKSINARVDYAVRGEAEEDLVSILRSVPADTIPNTFYRTRTGDFQFSTAEPTAFVIDRRPHPERALTSHEPYLRDGILWSDIAISRGCRYKCAFCSGSSHSSGIAYQQRDWNDIKSEIEYLVDEHRIGGIEIVDDLPFRTSTQLKGFLEFIRRSGFDLEWEVNIPITLIKRLSQHEFKDLRELGLRKIAFGVEAGQEDLRKSMGKTATDEEIFSLCRNLANEAISHKAYFIIGFPGESRSSIMRTVTLAEQLRQVNRRHTMNYVNPRVFVFKPFPGSTIWKNLLDAGHSEADLMKFVDFKVQNSYFNKHAWSSSLQFSEVPVSELHQLVDEFYQHE